MKEKTYLVEILKAKTDKIHVLATSKKDAEDIASKMKGVLGVLKIKEDKEQKAILAWK